MGCDRFRILHVHRRGGTLVLVTDFGYAVGFWWLPTISGLKQKHWSQLMQLGILNNYIQYMFQNHTHNPHLELSQQGTPNPVISQHFPYSNGIKGASLRTHLWVSSQSRSRNGTRSDVEDTVRSMALPAHDTSSFDDKEDVGCGKRGTGGFFSTSEQVLDHPKRGDVYVFMCIIRIYIYIHTYLHK